jgi:hypothetical protein
MSIKTRHGINSAGPAIAGQIQSGATIHPQLINDHRRDIVINDGVLCNELSLWLPIRNHIPRMSTIRRAMSCARQARKQLT